MKHYTAACACPASARAASSPPPSAPCRRRYSVAAACASATTPAAPPPKPRAPSRRNASSTTATTGIWTPGATCAAPCEVSRWSESSSKKPPPHNRRRVKSTRQNWTQKSVHRMAFSPAIPRHRARIRFTPAAAAWVANENWHPEQRGTWSPAGYELQIPYHNPTELIMDILRHGENAEVLSPPKLRQEVCKRLEAAHKKYKTK